MWHLYEQVRWHGVNIDVFCGTDRRTSGVLLLIPLLPRRQILQIRKYYFDSGDGTWDRMAAICLVRTTANRGDIGFHLK